MCVPTSKVDNKSLLQDLCSSLPVYSLSPTASLGKDSNPLYVGKNKVPQETVLSCTVVVFYLIQSCTFGCILQLSRTSERKAQYLIPLNNTELFFKVFWFQTALLSLCVESFIVSGNWQTLF